jgi:hypothetical protein
VTLLLTLFYLFFFKEDLDAVSNQLSDAQNRLVDYERKAKVSDADKLQLQVQLDDVRDILHAETTKYQNLSAQHERFKIDIEKRLIDKDEELDVQKLVDSFFFLKDIWMMIFFLRITNRRQIETLQESIESAEARSKSELNSARKKHQAEVEDLKSRYDLAKRAFVDAENNVKKFQQALKEISDKLFEEQHAHDADREQLISVEKRASSLRGEIEELKTLLDRVSRCFFFLFIFCLFIFKYLNRVINPENYWNWNYMMVNKS